jgi:hypothetical protein
MQYFGCIVSPYTPLLRRVAVMRLVCVCRQDGVLLARARTVGAHGPLRGGTRYAVTLRGGLGEAAVLRGATLVPQQLVL